MVSRRAKAAYFLIARYPMWANAFLYRHLRAPRSGRMRVHLGPGTQNYLEGWINVDANIVTARCDVWADISRRLPFHDETVDAFYSHHVIEHLPDGRLPYHFREMWRCLKPGGVIRIGGPSGDAAVQKLVEGDAKWFPDFPDSRESVGGRFVNFVFCRGEHLTMLTFSYLEELARSAGFVEVATCHPALTTGAPAEIGPEVFARERNAPTDVPHTLIVEARKPSRCST